MRPSVIFRTSCCRNLTMETPLSPVDFGRRTRRLHGHREAVVDGELRLSPGRYQLRASAALRYSNSSVLSNHRSTSYCASSRLPEACTRLATALPVAAATALD
jgi:hypothetical protein